VTTSLIDLKGTTVIKTLCEHDSLTLQFSNMATLNIHNKWNLDADNDGFSELAGLVVYDVVISKAEIEFLLGVEGKKNLRSLKVHLDPASYRGPEAMTLSFPGRPLIVWN
jgi:hypothetical protein